ncbi:MAG: conjugal transfer protein TraN [Formosimonas sp.]
MQLSRAHWGFCEGATIVHQFTNDAPLKAHWDYKAAKAGDIMAALRLIDGMLLNPNFVANVKNTYSGQVDFVLPIVAQELQGDNAIPLALAAMMSQKMDIPLNLDCYQTNKAYHTGADPMERLISRATFGGSIIPDKRYVLVDDVTAMGSTLADCASFVASQGGVVTGAIVLTNASRSGKLSPVQQDIRIIQERYNEDVKHLFSIAPQALTFDEARYLVGFRTSDELRDRAVKAAHERKIRIASKIVSKP